MLHELSGLRLWHLAVDGTVLLTNSVYHVNGIIGD